MASPPTVQQIVQKIVSWAEGKFMDAGDPEATDVVSTGVANRSQTLTSNPLPLSQASLLNRKPFQS